MAAMFFQGTLGSFMAYSQMGGSPVAQAPGPSGQPPGSYFTPAQEKNSSQGSSGPSPQLEGRSVMGSGQNQHVESKSPGALGNALVK